MRLAKTLAALLLVSLSFSCTVDPIDEDESIIQIGEIEDVLATGEDDNPPPPPPGGD